MKPAGTVFLEIPPFPGARRASLIREGDRTPLSDEAIDRALAAIARERVAGSFWGRQPVLPKAPYRLVRIRNWRLRQACLEEGRGSPQLCWTDGRFLALSGRWAQALVGPCDPWHLLQGAREVVTDGDDPLALWAAIAGVRVRCISAGCFDRVREGPTALESQREAFRRAGFDRLAFADPFTGEEIGLDGAIALCAFWRRLIDSNRPLVAAFGFAAWKRPTVRPLLWSGSAGLPFPADASGIKQGDPVAVWASRLSRRDAAELQRRGARLVEVEDGFIRSAGLGADCVPPLSITVDASGPYFDPRQASELEIMLQDGDFPAELLDRARTLRQLITTLGISKYAQGVDRLTRRHPERRHVLVTGQVEDDRSVLSGGGDVTTNLELLRRARADRPDAYIIYKPHPDVEAGHRKGAIPDSQCRMLADEILRDVGISAAIDLADEVQVNTSLAGFEALLRGKPVTTHGVPFYAGWGLTRDLGAVPERRTAKRTLDELVAAALLLYPRYLDPETGLPCPPEILIRRLAEGGVQSGALVSLRRLQGRLKLGWERRKDR